MSKPAPQAPPKQNFLQTLALMALVFMAFQLFTNGRQNAPLEYGKKSLATSDETWKALRDLDWRQAQTNLQARANADLGPKLNGSYDKLLNEDVEKKRLTEAQADEKRNEAAILTAHIQLKNGLFADESGIIRMAYATLENRERTEANKPVWSKAIPVVDEGKWGETTGHGLYTRIRDTLSARNKTDLVWGAIPGGFAFIDFLVGLTGHNPAYSYALATLLLAFIVRAVVFPLSQKQLMMSRQMSQLMPRLAEIKERYKDNQVEQNAKSMELYSRYGINPFAGCLPAVVQMPLFLTVYQCILHYQFEFTKGHFLWISPAGSKASHGFFAPDLGQQDYLLILIYGVTMVISTLLTPVNDPTQAKQQRMIGLAAAVIFPVMMLFRFFPVVSGFVLYWTFTNLFSMAQSLRAYRLPMPPLVEVNAPGGGVFPGKPKGKWAQMIEEAQKNAQQGGGPSKPSTPPQSNGKVSQPRVPKAEDKKDGGNGVPAKHKPKKRR